MRQLTTALAAAAAVLLLAACAKKEEAPAAPEAAPAEAAPAETMAPMDAADDGSEDAEATSSDKVSEPEPAPAGG